VDLGQGFDLRKNRPVTVVGVFTDNGSSHESEVWVDRDTLRSAFGREGGVSSVRVRLESPSKLDGFRVAVEQDKRLGLQVMRETTYYEKQSEDLSLFIRIMGTMIAVFFSIGAMIGAAITMYAAIANRQREIGTLRALGFSRLSILASFLAESMLLALVGGAIGMIASLGMGFVKFSMVNFASWSEIVFTFDPTPEILGTTLIFALVMGLFGGFFPAIRAARVSPVVAMRA
jgi:putative ABC transport system permease protein